MKTEKLLKLVITDRYCINDHRTNLNKDLSFFIRKIDLNSARILVNNSDIYMNHFRIQSDYMRAVFEQLLEKCAGPCEEQLFKIDDETTFLIVSLDKNGQPQFHLIGDEIPCQVTLECRLN